MSDSAPSRVRPDERDHVGASWRECPRCKAEAEAYAASSAPAAPRYNISAQEDTVSALWDFARAVIAMGDAQEANIRGALARIVHAYGYEVASIQ